MLSLKQFEQIEFIFRHLKDASKPFGGCQVRIQILLITKLVKTVMYMYILNAADNDCWQEFLSYLCNKYFQFSIFLNKAFNIYFELIFWQ